MACGYAPNSLLHTYCKQIKCRNGAERITNSFSSFVNIFRFSSSLCVCLPTSFSLLYNKFLCFPLSSNITIAVVVVVAVFSLVPYHYAWNFFAENLLDPHNGWQYETMSKSWLSNVVAFNVITLDIEYDKHYSISISHVPLNYI